MCRIYYGVLKMTQTVYRQIKEFDGDKYTTIIDIKNGITLFDNDIEKGLGYFENAGGTFLANEVTGEIIYGEIQYDDILFCIEAMECGEFEYDDSIYNDFMAMKRCCEDDWKNENRYASDFFNIYIL